MPTLSPQNKHPEPNKQEAGWASQKVWIIWRIEKFLPLLRIETQIIQLVYLVTTPNDISQPHITTLITQNNNPS
jgi:hypothetical protein